MREAMPVHRGLIHVLVLMSCLLICAVPGRATPEGEWLTVGIGRGNDDSRESNELFDEAGFLLGGSILRDAHIWTLRHARVGFEQSSGDVAFLYERVLSRQRVLVSVGAGVGLLYRDQGGTSFEPTCCVYESAPEKRVLRQGGHRLGSPGADRYPRSGGLGPAGLRVRIGREKFLGRGFGGADRWQGGRAGR
ncbi:MAG: hypothetical protein IPG61_02680 [bacterium]|nr:hypothetical protein [bacterium]